MRGQKDDQLDLRAEMLFEAIACRWLGMPLLLYVLDYPTWFLPITESRSAEKNISFPPSGSCT
jgi:hypothetical protein